MNIYGSISNLLQYNSKNKNKKVWNKLLENADNSNVKISKKIIAMLHKINGSVLSIILIFQYLFFLIYFVCFKNIINFMVILCTEIIEMFLTQIEHFSQINPVHQ